MRITIGAAVTAVAVTAMSLTSCSTPPPPSDQITEIEVQRSGDGKGGFTESLAVETHGEGQYGVRKGARINVGDRLWKQIDRNDLLMEQPNARKGDAPDLYHEGEQSDDEATDSEG